MTKIAKQKPHLFLYGVIKRFWRWRHRNLTIIIIAISLIIINGTLAIVGFYPLWIGCFNYLIALSPIYLFFEKKRA